MKKIKYYPKIEDMSSEELEKRIKFGFNFKIPHKIKAIPYIGEKQQITEYAFDELIARCPMTELRDQYKVVIRFIANKNIPELKSLKFYFWDYEELRVPISHEHLASKIYKEFKKIIKPKNLYLKLEVAGRGSLFTTITVGDIKLEFLKERKYKNL